MTLASHQSDVTIANLNRGLINLTDREWDVLLLISHDLTNTEIAERLFLTRKSVVNYRNRIGSKLDLRGRDALARFARQNRDSLRQWQELISGKLPSSGI